MSEREVFNRDGVLVTTKRLVALGTTYQLRTITSVRMKPAPSRIPGALLFAVIAAAGLAMGSRGSAMCGIFGFLSIIATVGALLTPGKAELFVTTSAREQRALRGSTKLITETERALNAAMAEAE